MFTQTPDNYASLYGNLQYGFESVDTKDVTINVMDYNKGVCIGVKKFYSTSDLYVNVAPIIRPLATPTLSTKEMAFLSNENFGHITVELEACDEDDTIVATSDTRIFTLSRQGEEGQSALSTMPDERLIALNECDIVSAIGEPQSEVQATISYHQFDE